MRKTFVPEKKTENKRKVTVAFQVGFLHKILGCYLATLMVLVMRIPLEDPYEMDGLKNRNRYKLLEKFSYHSHLLDFGNPLYFDAEEQVCLSLKVQCYLVSRRELCLDNDLWS